MRLSIHPENNQLAKYKAIIHQYLSKDEIKCFHHKSDLKGALEVSTVWFWIAFSFAIVGIWPNFITIFLALWILAGKQLGCAIILHDCSHYSLFKSKRLNDIVGNWLGAYPNLQNIHQYRPYHLQHHVATGTSDDPDINLTKGYPTTMPGMTRKLFRDISGITGLKGIIGVLFMHMGFLRYNLGNKIEKIPAEEISLSTIMRNSWLNLRGPLTFHILFFGIFWLLGKPWLYFLWWAAFLTTYNVVLRIRSMAEHSMVEDSKDVLSNTRTTYANPIEKMLFAPLHVNYHNEHHMMVAAPCYNYPKLHVLLKERGFYRQALLAPNYRVILQKAILRQAEENDRFS